jgi:hypothetical protein
MNPGTTTGRPPSPWMMVPAVGVGQWRGDVGQLISAHIDSHSPRLNAAMTKCGSW